MPEPSGLRLAGGEKDLEALRRCYAHLESGGAFVVDIQAEHTSPETWNIWLPDRRRALPEPWPEDGRANAVADGSELVERFRTVQVDPLEQSWTRQVRLEEWRSGRLIAREEYALRGNTYLKNELLLMLQVAGFREITVQGDYTDEPATADHEELVFTALR